MRGQKIGFIGTGIMGSSMVKNLLKGLEVFVYNRTRSKCSELLEAGARWCETPADLARQVEVVLLCLTDAAAVEEVIFGPSGLVSAESAVRVIVDHSTIAPSAARRIASELAGLKIAFLDAPLTGGDVGAREGTLTIMVGGVEAEFDALRPVFSWMAKKIIYTGPSGNGQLTKCVNQLVCAGTIAAMTEGLYFAERAGLDLENTMECISSGAAGSWALANYGPRILQGNLQPGFHARNQLKDLRFVVQEADQLNTALPVTALVKELFLALVEGGDGELGNHALIKLYQRINRQV